MDFLGSFLFPRRCAICDEILKVGQENLCPACHGIPREVGEDCCVYCGKPVAEEEECCDDCRDSKRSFQYGRSALWYDAAMRQSISRFKYHGRQEYAGYYGAVLEEKFGDWIREVEPQALIPVPLHKKRYQKRGYNQAELIARELGRRCSVPVDGEYLFRKRETTPQKELSRGERQKNLRDAFYIGNVSGELCKYKRCVIIIDDIYTTGSTVESCSHVLRTNGTDKVYFLCVCTGKGY